MLTSEVSAVGYTGTGATATYNFPFKIQDKTHLLVAKRDTAGAETILVVDVDFTIDSAFIGKDAGGDIVLTAGNLPSGYALVLRRKPPAKQLLDLKGEGTFYAKDHESAFDYGVMLAQRLFDLLGNAIKLPESEIGVDASTRLPTKELRANRYFSWDSNGNPVAVTVVSVGAVTISAFMETVLDDANAAAARTTLGVTFTETTPAQVTANQATWSPTLGNFRTLVRGDSNGDWLIRGVAGGAVGIEWTFVYVGATGSLTFKNEDAAAGAASQRLLNFGGVDLTLESGDSATWRYDSVSSRWRQIA